MRFSIIIPTYNRVLLLEPTLESVFEIEVPEGGQVELVVIDNNCSDGTADMVRRSIREAPFSSRHVVEYRQGLCFGRNRGLAEARYEHVIYLDDDVRVRRDWLLGYQAAVDRWGADCVVGPVTPVFEGKVPADFSQRVIDSIGSAYSRKGDAAFVVPANDSAQLPGCNFGVRAAVAEAVGGFRTNLDRVGKGLLAGGDTEFGMRLGEAGKRIVYEPRCAIEHVITAEKLTHDYMRRRWYGLGLTTRALSQKKKLTAVTRIRSTIGAARMLSAAVTRKLAGDSQLAFQRELEARRAWGYLRGRPIERSKLEWSDEPDQALGERDQA